MTLGVRELTQLIRSPTPEAGPIVPTNVTDGFLREVVTRTGALAGLSRESLG